MEGIGKNPDIALYNNYYSAGILVQIINANVPVNVGLGNKFT